MPVNVNLAKYMPALRAATALPAWYEFVPDEAQGGNAQRLQINAELRTKDLRHHDPPQTSSG